MHFFEEFNYIDSVVKLDVVKLIGDGEVDEKFVILRLSHTITARRIVHIKEGVMHRVKNDNDLKLTSLSLPHLTVLLQAHHLLKQDTAEVISHERLLALIHQYEFVLISVCLWPSSLPVSARDRLSLQPEDRVRESLL